MTNFTPDPLARVALLAAALASAPSLAAPLAVDGNLSDWGLTVADNNASQLVPSIPTLGYSIEDQSDTAGDGGYVGPHYGGQNYDVEFLGVAVQGSRLYLAIVSGLRPDNGFARYGPGDLRLTINGINYGIEVGGGAGGGPGGAITEGTPGSTYTLDGSGFTVGHATTVAAQTAGSIWRAPSWINAPIPPSEPVQFQGGTYVGTADYVYTRNSVTQQHSIIELSLETALFGGIHSLEVEWGPTCGNDVLAAVGLISTPNDRVPEPGALSLMAAALAAVALRRRRGRESRAAPADQAHATV